MNGPCCTLYGAAKERSWGRFDGHVGTVLAIVSDMLSSFLPMCRRVPMSWTILRSVHVVANSRRPRPGETQTTSETPEDGTFHGGNKMRLKLEWLAVPAVLAALGMPCFAVADSLGSPAAKDLLTPEHVAQIEAELVDLSAQVDALRAADSERSSKSYTSSGGCGNWPGSDSGTCCAEGSRADPCDACTVCPMGCNYQPCGFYAGYAFVFAKPYFTDGANYVSGVTGDIPPGSGNTHDTTSVPFSYDFEVTPRIWIGYTSRCGLGARARYWEFDHAGDAVDAVVPVGTGNEGVFAVIGSPWWDIPSIQPQGEGIPLSITNRVELHAADFELTQQMDFCHTWVVASLGLRYASIAQSYQAETSGFLGARRALSSSASMDGLGPTLALEMRRPLGRCGWGVFAEARGSALFGEAHIRQRRVDRGTPSIDSFSRDAFTIVGVGELQFGVEWSRRFTSGSAILLRGAYEGQLWLGAGSPSHASGDLGFEGASVAIGFAR